MKNIFRFIRNLNLRQVFALTTLVFSVLALFSFATGGTWFAAATSLIAFFCALAYGAAVEDTVKVYGAMQWW